MVGRLTSLVSTEGFPSVSPGRVGPWGSCPPHAHLLFWPFPHWAVFISPLFPPPFPVGSWGACVSSGIIPQTQPGPRMQISITGWLDGPMQPVGRGRWHSSLGTRHTPISLCTRPNSTDLDKPEQRSLASAHRAPRLPSPVPGPGVCYNSCSQRGQGTQPILLSFRLSFQSSSVLVEELLGLTGGGEEETSVHKPLAGSHRFVDVGLFTPVRDGVPGPRCPMPPHGRSAQLSVLTLLIESASCRHMAKLFRFRKDYLI